MSKTGLPGDHALAVMILMSLHNTLCRLLSAASVMAIYLQLVCIVLLQLFYISVICQFSADEEQAIRDPILAKYEKEGHPYYSSARYLNLYCYFVTLKKFDVLVSARFPVLMLD